LDLEDTVPEVGIWNGKEVVFTMNEGGWWDIARLFWRYGYAPVKANALMKETVGRFLRMYERPVFPWRSLSDVVQLVGLTEVTGLTGEQYLKNKGIGEKFSNEIIQARSVDRAQPCINSGWYKVDDHVQNGHYTRDPC
jgi:prenylcysteine oxidase/farnesylcysteine lyase